EQRNQVLLIESSAQQLLDLIVDGMAKLLAVQRQNVDAVGDSIGSNAVGSADRLPDVDGQRNAAQDMQELSDRTGIVDGRYSLSGRVLVADDNQIDRMIARKLLEMSGLEVAVVRDGAEAVDTVQCNRYDLVFMDMEMPGKNGYEATRELRSMGVETPIVALTAHALKTDRAKCLAAGCNDYLAKPIDRTELLR
ncbi:response regulator, partial [Anaerobaca lacustris]|nr:response regulator [Sedimentisphaerales bacterium M17dextr]